MLTKSDIESGMWKPYSIGKTKPSIESRFNRLIEGIFSLFDGIKSVWQWLPIIYKDRHYSEHYLLVLMRFKVGKMLESYKGADGFVTEDFDEVCADLQEVYDALDRLVEDAYSEYQDEVDKKYGELEMYHKGDMLDFYREKVITEEDAVECLKLETEVYRKSEEKRQKDVEFVAEKFKKINDWWL